MNKMKDNNPLYRTNGSIDIAGAVRSILAITRTPNKEAPAERYLVQVKSNLAPTGSAILFEVAEKGVDFISEMEMTAEEAFLSLAPQKLKETVADPQHFHIIFDPVNVLTADTAAHQAEFWPGWCEVIGKDLACIHMKDALFVPNAPRIPTPLGEGQMDYTILRDWLHREHPDAALLRDEVILSAAQRDLNFIRAM